LLVACALLGAPPCGGARGWTARHPLSTIAPSARPSLGIARDTKCIDPPPPLRGDLSAHRRSGAPAPSHLKYLALDGSTDLTTQAWTNMGFIHPSAGKPSGPGWAGYVTSMYINETLLDAYNAAGYDVFINMEVEITNQARQDGPPWGFNALEAWKAAWIGPSTGCYNGTAGGGCYNGTTGGIWNNSVAALAAAKKIKGVYFGDELLGGGWSVSNLTEIITMVKDTWPEGVTYCKCSRSLCVFSRKPQKRLRTDNEEWEPINNPEWTDGDGQPYGKVPPALDLISYDVSCASQACVA